MPVSVHQTVVLESNRVDSPSAGGVAAISIRRSEHDYARSWRLLPIHKALCGQEAPVVGPYERLVFDVIRDRLAVEDELTVLRAAHPHLRRVMHVRKVRPAAEETAH
jgi:hypothetical protein